MSLELAESRHQLSRALFSLGQYEGSLDAIQQARQGLQSLLTTQPEDPIIEESSPCWTSSAPGVLCRLGQLDQAAEAIPQALVAIHVGMPTDRPVYLRVAGYEAARLGAEILRHQGRFEQGLKLCERGRYLCFTDRMNGLLDHRDLARCEVALTCELAELHAAAGDLPQAAEQFRKALLLRQQTLMSRVKPIQHARVASLRANSATRSTSSRTRFANTSKSRFV